MLKTSETVSLTMFQVFSVFQGQATGLRQLTAAQDEVLISRLWLSHWVVNNLVLL